MKVNKVKKVIKEIVYILTEWNLNNIAREFQTVDYAVYILTEWNLNVKNMTFKDLETACLYFNRVEFK